MVIFLQAIGIYAFLFFFFFFFFWGGGGGLEWNGRGSVARGKCGYGKLILFTNNPNLEKNKYHHPSPYSY